MSEKTIKEKEISEKLCPLFYVGFLSFRGQFDQTDTSDILCLQEQCALFDEKAGKCGLLPAKAER
jgi:hypothetical protein